jgi:hypothetical protein
VYGEHKISYRTFDRSATEVLRLSFKPVRITAGGQALSERGDLHEPGYTIRALPGGDYVIRIRRIDSNEISIS